MYAVLVNLGISENNELLKDYGCDKKVPKNKKNKIGWLKDSVVCVAIYDEKVPCLSREF